jgi:indolepyruvate decarboxylase
MPNVADFLIERIENAGAKHIFGVPGDYVLQFIRKINESKKTTFINTTDEAHAGFAADAYARVNGIGCVCATYNVGALKLCNAIAGAYAEKSPVLVISGSPGVKERNDDFLLHHVVRSFENQQKIFKNITSYSVILDDPTKAGFFIDEAFEALQKYKQPVYIELPRDVAEMPLRYDVYRQGTPANKPSDPEVLIDATNEVMNWIKNSKNPVIMAGVQIARFGLGDSLVRFAERHNIPMVTTLLSKSTINEHHPLFAGVYSGSQTTQDNLRKLVDDSDCLLIFGEMLTDMTLGFESPKFKKNQTIFCSIEGLKVRNHSYDKINFLEFCTNLFKLDFGKKENLVLPEKKQVGKFIPNDTKITTERFFDKIDSVLAENSNLSVIADIGECLFGSSELTVQHHQFLSPAFYCSMGFAIPGALGFMYAKSDARPIVLVGDGAFQMSATELSTFLQNKLNPIVIVLNNRGYTTERFLLDGDFNNIRNWNYHKINELLGGGSSAIVETEKELESSFAEAIKCKELYLINVCVDSKDISKNLQRMVNNLAKRV